MKIEMEAFAIPRLNSFPGKAVLTLCIVMSESATTIRYDSRP